MAIKDKVVVKRKPHYNGPMPGVLLDKCPKCGSGLMAVDHNKERPDDLLDVECEDCGFEWTENTT